MQVCTVAPVPGETKVWQYITLMKRVFLIDCPGVVYAGDPSNSDDAATVLKGVVRIERLEDAAAYIPALMERVKPEYLVRFLHASWVCMCTALAALSGTILEDQLLLSLRILILLQLYLRQTASVEDMRVWRMFGTEAPA